MLRTREGGGRERVDGEDEFDGVASGESESKGLGLGVSSPAGKEQACTQLGRGKPEEGGRRELSSFASVRSALYT